MSQIFISYRRDGGDALAYTLYRDLTDRGYTVFFDTESLRDGDFDVRLYDEIRQCKDFLLVLPRGALDRCIPNENDWLRLEIAHALKHHKNIIPVLMNGFSFPDDPEILPKDIRSICTKNGVNFDSMEYVGARIDKICTFLRSIPVSSAKPRQPERKILKPVLSFLAEIFITAGSAVKNAVTTAFKAVASFIRMICGALWKFRLTRYAALFLLSALVLYYSVDIVRDFNHANKDQWIRLKNLCVAEPFTNGINITEDNTMFALNSGDGYIELKQIVGNNSQPITIRNLETSFRNEKVGVAFDNNICYVVGEDRIEEFNFYSGALLGTYSFPDYDPDMNYAYVYFLHQLPGYLVVRTNTTGDKLSRCVIYRKSEGGLIPTSFDISGYDFICKTNDDRYYLFLDSTRNPIIIDAIEQCEVQEPEKLMTEKFPGNAVPIDKSYHMIDSDNRYFLHIMEGDMGFRSFIITDMQSGSDIFTRAYMGGVFLGFEEDGTFLVLSDVINSDYEWDVELHRVDYLHPYADEEVVLANKDFTEILGADEIERLSVHYFDDTDMILAVFNDRIYLIDTKEKLAKASSNPLTSDKFTALTYSFSEIHNNIIISDIIVPTENAGEDFSELIKKSRLSAWRFSFEKQGGKIVVVEDDYADESKYLKYILCPLSLAGLIIFICAGRSSRKN